jgi:quinol monooxygenase YgiN
VLIVAGALYVAPGDREEYLAGCRAVVAQARTADGCLDFALSPDPVAADRINVYERWQDRHGLEAFRGAGPDPAQAGRLVAADVVEYEVWPFG